MVELFELPKKENNVKKKRDWSKYNEQLVERYDLTVYMEPSIFHLPENSKCRGRPVKYPDAYFRFALIVRFLMNLPYRGLEGVFRTLFENTGFEVPDYTTFYRRCNSLEIDTLKEKWGFWKQLAHNGPIVIAVDTSGIKVNAYSEWMRHKWGDDSRERKGWIKLHVAVDAKTHTPIDVEVSDERTGDSPMFIPLIEGCLEKGIEIKRVLADGAYDSREIFNYLDGKDIDVGIRLPKNASTRSRGCPKRAEEARFIRDYGAEIWKITRNYNLRWSVERFFGAFKTVFGEYVRARLWEHIVFELIVKVLLYHFIVLRPIFKETGRF